MTRRNVRSFRVVQILGATVLGACAALFAPAGQAWAANCGSDAAPGVDWSNCAKKMLLLAGSDLSGANLSDGDFTSTDFRDTNLAGANLEKATLVRASLAGAHADKAKFTRIEAYRSTFAGVSAQGASFANAELERTDFTGANLTGADFQKAELGRAVFDKAVITGASFPTANLSRVEFRTATFEGPVDLTNAFLFLTRLEGLDLSQAKGLQQWQVDLACGDASTKLPAGLKAPATWPCKFEND